MLSQHPVLGETTVVADDAGRFSFHVPRAWAGHGRMEDVESGFWNTESQDPTHDGSDYIEIEFAYTDDPREVAPIPGARRKMVGDVAFVEYRVARMSTDRGEPFLTETQAAYHGAARFDLSDGTIAVLNVYARSDTDEVDALFHAILDSVEVSGTGDTLQFTHQGWTTYYSPDLRLTFDFPQRAGTTSYSWGDGPEGHGKIVSWGNTLPPANEEEERELGRGYGYEFAGAYGVDAGYGYRWITDTVMFSDGHNGTHLIRGKGENVQRVPIDPIRRVTWMPGHEAVIFDSRDYWGESEPSLEGFAATANLPGNYHEQIKSLTFYFHDVHDDGRTRRRWHTTSIEDVERVVRSIALDVSAEDWERLQAGGA